MRIQHNIMAMNAYRNYNTNTSALAKNLEKLSSGYKINRAGDDAAGLAISEKMRAQITGLNAAQKNVKDGISLVKTAEGAMQEVQDMLNRMVDLATQSANGTYQDEVDREAIQAEIDQLNSEINRIADSANFNGIKLLDGSLDKSAVTGVSYNKVGADEILSLLPDKMLTGNTQTGADNGVDKVDTIGALETDGNVAPSKNAFEISLDGVSVTTGKDNQVFTLKIGEDKTLSATLKKAGTYSGAQLAKALAEQNKDKGLEGFGDEAQKFDVTANGNVLKFSNTTEKDAGLNTSAKVTWTLVEGGDAPDGTTVTDVNPGDANTFASFSADVPLKAGTVQIAGKYFALSGATTQALVEPDGSEASPFTINMDGQTKDQVLTAIAEKLQGVSIDGIKGQFNASVEGGKLKFTATEKGAIQSTDGKELDKAAFTAALKDVVKADGASDPEKPEEPAEDPVKVTAPTSKTISATAFDSGKAAAKFEFNLAGFEVDKAGKVDFTIGGAIYEVEITDEEIKNKGTKSLAEVATEKLVDAMNTKKLNDATGAGEFTAVQDGTVKTKITLTGTDNSKDVSSDFKTDMATFNVAAQTSGTGGSNGGILALADSSLGGTAGTAVKVKDDSGDGDAAVYSFALTGKGEADVDGKAIDGETIAWKTDLDTTMAEFVKSYNADTSKAYTAEYASGKLTLTAKEAGAVTTDPTTDISGVTASEDTAGADPTTPAVTMNASGLTTEAIKTAADGTEGIADGKLTITMNADKKLELKIGDKVIGTSDEAVTNSTTTYNFKAADGKTSLGKVVLSAGVADTDITDALETGLSYVAATTEPEKPGTEEPKTELVASGKIDMSSVATADLNDETATFDATDLAALKTIFAAGTKTKINSEVEVDLGGIADGFTANKETVADLAAAMKAKAEEAIKAWNEANGETKGYTYGNVRISTTDDATGVIALAGNDGLYILADKIPAGQEETADGTNKTTGYINTGIQNVTNYNAGSKAQPANATVDFGEVGAWQDGAKITIGSETYTVALGTNSIFKDVKNVIHLTDEERDSEDFKSIAAKKLSAAAAGNATFTVGHYGDGKTTLQQRSSAKDTTDMTTKAKFAGYLGVSIADSTDGAVAGKGLTLQIGDTSESFNQLTVSIGDIHADALGVGSINVGTQEGAQAAINVIKTAINNVSSIRGTLGATQNRLEHTSNNLSVMAENIQDAESSIRDTDIAEEMMAYTKNNILVQSAQAMLAQANQVPQGVLQLLG